MQGHLDFTNKHVLGTQTGTEQNRHIWSHPANKSPLKGAAVVYSSIFCCRWDMCVQNIKTNQNISFMQRNYMSVGGGISSKKRLQPLWNSSQQVKKLLPNCCKQVTLWPFDDLQSTFWWSVLTHLIDLQENTYHASGWTVAAVTSLNWVHFSIILLRGVHSYENQLFYQKNDQIHNQLVVSIFVKIDNLPRGQQQKCLKPPSTKSS